MNYELWKAKGFSLWALTEASSIIAPIAQDIQSEYPDIYPIMDGHLTIWGNLPANMQRPPLFLPTLMDMLKGQILNFTSLRIDSSKPSQTLIVVAEEAERVNLARQYISESTGIELPRTFPPIHTSVIYNSAKAHPLRDPDIKRIPQYNELQALLPFRSAITSVCLVRTEGTPQEWDIIERV